MSYRFITFNGVKRFVPFSFAEYESLIRRLPYHYAGRAEWLYLNGVSLEACLIRLRFKLGLISFDNHSLALQYQ